MLDTHQYFFIWMAYGFTVALLAMLVGYYVHRFYRTYRIWKQYDEQ